MRATHTTRILLLTLLILSQSCAIAKQSQPIIVLISFDTFRADAIEDSVTPALARFSRDAVTFERAFVPYPHTLTSHATLLTGVYPGVHRVFPKGLRLSENIQTIAQLLKSNDYNTIGLVTTEWLKKEFGFARSFDHYEVLPHDLTYADRVNAKALRLLEEVTVKDRRLFLFLHYYDAHSDFGKGGSNKLPYYSPKRYRTNLESRDNEFCDSLGRCSTRYLMEADKARTELPESHIQKIFSLYLSGIRALDEEMGIFFDELRRRGLYDDALIIVTSDHGEEFREHGRFIHSQPYDETISVPLMIKLPNSQMAGLRISDPVENVDVLPTILAKVSIDKPAYLQGRDLFDSGPAPGPPNDVLAQDSIAFFRYALRTEDFKYITNLKHDQSELYDLQADPAELVNLAAARPDLAQELEQRLISMIRMNRAASRRLDVGSETTEELFSPEERENLKALGYLN